MNFSLLSKFPTTESLYEEVDKIRANRSSMNALEQLRMLEAIGAEVARRLSLKEDVSETEEPKGLLLSS